MANTSATKGNLMDDYGPRISVLESRVDSLESSYQAFKVDNSNEHGDILNALTKLADKLSNRLPLWATMGFGLMLATIGWLAK